jgi:hypothetical protein
MTNLEIIASEVITRELLTKEQVNEMLEKFGMLPYMTYQEWKYKGYQVKKGSKAIIKTKLWKRLEIERKMKIMKKKASSLWLALHYLIHHKLKKIEKVAQA